MNVHTKFKEHYAIDTAKAVELWASGMQQTNIAARFGVSEGAMKNFIQKHRVLFPIRERSKVHREDTWAREDIAEASAMWKANKPASVIGARFKVNRTTILGLAFRNRELFPMKNKKQKQIMRFSTPKQRVEKVRREVEAFHGETLPEVLPNEYDFGRLPDAKTLLDLDRGECKWPVNKGGPFMFCAAEAEGNYCNHHFIRSRRAV